jgi:pyruvate,water dikinase
MTGYGGMEELRISADLWAVSREQLSMDVFLARHGYHGPSEGELSSRSWREKPAPVEALRDAYRSRPDSESPIQRERERAAVRRDAEAALLGSLPRHRRGPAQLTLKVAARFVPLREVGKAAFLQTIDGGRAAARELGTELVTTGVIADPDADLRALVDHRRALRARYRARQLPERWTGEPTAISIPLPDRDSTELIGVPVSGGTVEGRARVVIDPGLAGDFEPGDVLVCETTDPSWVVLFQLAAAVVIDVGGPLSHGAIVARELGIPAVINTRTATRTIVDGSRVRVNGTTGHVDLLTPDGSPLAA